MANIGIEKGSIMNMIKSLFLAAILISWQIGSTYPVRKGFNCKQEQSEMFTAAQSGKINILQLYQDNKCPMKIKDANGFSLYDIASLYGKQDVVQWLIKHRIAQQGYYSPALYKLLQTGLRFLNHDAGIINGKMNKATAEGIKSFQKSIGQKMTGKLNITWLPVFHTQVTKKMQLKLSELGYRTGKADGIIGTTTQSAIKRFRQERKISKGSYDTINHQLIYQLMMAENEAHKKAIAKKNAERRIKKKSQQIVQRKEREKMPISQTKKQGYPSAVTVNRMTAEKYAVENAATNALLQEKHKPQILVIRQTEKDMLAKKNTQVNKAALSQNSSGGFVRQQKGDSVRNYISVNKPSVAESTPLSNTPQPDLSLKRRQNIKIPGYQKIYGKLQLQGSGGRLLSCSLSGKSIDIAWCQQYYPSGGGKSCSAVMTNKGTIYSLTCK